MNIAEMHIAINLGVQKLASNQVDMLLTEEIDFEINKGIERFVSQRYNKLGNKYGTGVEESQKRIDDLRTLITEFSESTFFKGQISNKYSIDSFQLPSAGTFTNNVPAGLLHYRHLLNARSLVLYNNCNPIETSVIPGGVGIIDEQYIEITSGGSNYYSTPQVIFPAPSSGGTAATGVCTIDAGGTITNISVVDPGYGYTSADFPLNLSIVNNIPPTLYTESVLYSPGVANVTLTSTTNFNTYTSNLGYGVKTTDPPTPPSMQFPSSEVYIDSTTGPDKIILNTPPVGTASLTSGVIEITDYSSIITAGVSGVSGLAETSEASGITVTSFVGDHETRVVIGDDSQSTSAVNKYVQLDDIYTLLDDPFNTTKYNKPLMTIRDNFLDIYTDDTFIVNKVKITYIRKPVTVVHADSALATSGAVDCDLPQHTHQEIIELTVNSILEGIQDPRYRSHFSTQVMNSE
jgi:hypothetical protein